MEGAPTVCCAGEAMIEFAPAGDGAYRRGVAGDTLNTAVYLRRSGVPVRYLSAVGDDVFSAAIIDLLRQERIDHREVAVMPGRQPGLYVIHNDVSGERAFSYWRGQSPAREMFDGPVQVEAADVFYFSGITLAVCRSGIDNLRQLLATLRQQHCKVVFDPNFRPALWDDVEQARQHYREILPLCDTVLPTLDDDVALWGHDSVASCHDFYRGLGVQELVIKTPGLTACGFLQDERHERQAAPVEVVDTTGAGDAFAAGYLAARLQGQDMPTAIAAAQSLAARVVRCCGAIIPRD